MEEEIEFPFEEVYFGSTAKLKNILLINSKRTAIIAVRFNLLCSWVID